MKVTQNISMIFRSVAFLLIFLAHFESIGQSLVMDIDTSTEASNPKGMKVGKSGVVFLAETPEYGLELFRSNGTAEGTTIFMDHMPGPSDIVLWEYEVFGDHVFYAIDKVKVIEIRKASIKDGTSTLICKIDTRLDYQLNERDRFKLRFTELNDLVFFFLPNEVEELDLWTINTKNDQAKVVHTFPKGFHAQLMVPAQDQVFFSVSKFYADTCQLWSYHPEQKQAVYNGPLFGRFAAIEDIVTLQNSVFFIYFDSGDRDKHKQILWTSDGKLNGLRPFLNPISEQAMLRVEFLQIFKGKLYILDFSEQVGKTLWRLSNEKSPPEAILTSKKGEHSLGNGSQFAITQDFIYYKFYKISTGAYSLCRTNGEIGNTTTLVDFPKREDPAVFRGSGDCLYYPDKNDHVLWKIGDKEASPSLIYQLPDSLRISAYTVKVHNANGPLFHAIDGKGMGKHLLYSAGTPTTTTLFAYTPNGVNEHLRCNMFWQDKLFLTLHTPQYGIELWVYEATKGLSLLKDINARNAGSQPVVMTPFRGSIYACIRDRFYSFNQDSKYVKITPSPTPKVSEIGIKTLHTGENIQLAIPDSLMIIDKRFVVSEEKTQKLFPHLRDITYITKFQKSHLIQGIDEKVGREYWLVDEKFEKIKLLKDIALGREVGENSHQFVKMSDTLGLFVVKSRDIGSVIWRTNGRPQGTFPICKELEELMDKSWRCATRLW